MKEFIKKYITHIFNIICMIYMTIILTYATNAETYNEKIFIPLLIIEGLFVIGVWVEIIYYIIHAIKHKEIKNNALCAVLIYFLNMIYIPCYSMKYISKDENHKRKNTIYLIISIILYVIMIGAVIKLSLNNVLYERYTSDDKNINIKIPYNYDKTKVGEYDMYFESDTSNIGIFIYDEEDITPEEILEFHEQEIITTRNNVKQIDTKTKTTNTKTIKTDIFEGINNGEENIYRFTIITYKNKPNYTVYVIEATLKEDYINNKEELETIIQNINLNF